MRVFDQVDPQRVERRELQLTMLSKSSSNAILAAGAALLDVSHDLGSSGHLWRHHVPRHVRRFSRSCVLLVGYLFDLEIVVRRFAMKSLSSI